MAGGPPPRYFPALTHFHLPQSNVSLDPWDIPPCWQRIFFFKHLNFKLILFSPGGGTPNLPPLLEPPPLKHSCRNPGIVCYVASF